jgi:hypothetical protein
MKTVKIWSYYSDYEEHVLEKPATYKYMVQGKFWDVHSCMFQESVFHRYDAAILAEWFLVFQSIAVPSYSGT